MKKIISVLFALCVCLSISAQEHMKFMGIPLNGTIENFALKLKAKGVTYDAAKSKAMSPGCKLYNGTFMGEKATFMVFFNSKSRVVFGVSVEMSFSSVELAFTPFKNIVEQLKKKYPKATCKEYTGPDGDVDGLAIEIFYEAGENMIGFILQTLKAPSSGYGISIYLTYTDSDNFMKSEEINNEDL